MIGYNSAKGEAVNKLTLPTYVDEIKVALADGVIVGSACVKTIGESQNPVEAAKEFAQKFGDTLIMIRTAK